MSKLSDGWRTPQWLYDELNTEFNFDVDLCANNENSKCRYYYKDCLHNTLPLLTTGGDYFGNLILAKQQINCAFMNPPYSNPKPFIEKAWEDAKYFRIVCLVKCDPSTKWWAMFWEYKKEIYTCPQCDEEYEAPMLTSTQKSSQSCFPCCCGYLVVLKRKIYNGPKPGCEIRFLQKRVQFDPPIELIASEDCVKLNNTWYIRCDCPQFEMPKKCNKCMPNGFKKLSGPTFPSAILIFDRRKTL